jgi:hypothetical protein
VGKTNASARVIATGSLGGQRAARAFFLAACFAGKADWRPAVGAPRQMRVYTMAETTLRSMSVPARSTGRLGRFVGQLALVVGVLCALAALLSGPAYRFEWLPLGPALQTMRWAATVAIGGAVVALVALLLLAARPARPPARGVAALALLINVLVAAPPLFMYSRLQALPKIHDITTNTDHPPTFDAVVPLRKGARNSIDYVAATAAEQHKGCPDIAALMLPLARLADSASAPS